MRIFALSAILLASLANAQTAVSGSLTKSNGDPIAARVTVSWTAFMASDWTYVPGGSTTFDTGSDGSFSVSLRANAGARPAGSGEFSPTYTVSYPVDGAHAREAWTVPASSTATLAQVRARQ